MKLRRLFFSLVSTLIISYSGICQEKESSGIRILFQGLVMDASTLTPIPNSQIMINRAFSSVSGNDGTFAFYVNRKDTVVFKRLGYKSTMMYVSDTLTGNEFIAGVYMNTDTLAIGEVIIIPRFRNLKSEILNSKSKTPSTFENARYNVAVSAYQGRTNKGTLGNPTDNYAALRQKQKTDAYEKGQISSDKIVGFNPLLLIPATYVLLKGVPGKSASFNPDLTNQEVEQINKKYLESLRQRK
jgi:hypothetical protein